MVAGWVARLVDRLIDDPAFALVGIASGTDVPARAGRVLPFLQAERAVAGMRYPEYDMRKASAFLSGLPDADLLRSDCAADLVLALSERQLSEAELEGSGLTEWSLLMAGQPADLAAQGARAYLALGSPLVPVTLIGRRHGQGAQPLCTAQYNVKPSAALLARFLQEKAVPLLLRLLRCQCRGVPLTIGAADSEDPLPEPSGARGMGLAYPAGLLGAVGKRAAGIVRDRLGRPKDTWELRLGEGTPDRFDPRAARKLQIARHALADPFLFSHDGTLHVFYETYGRFGGNAWIEVARLDRDEITPLGTALQCDYHLSFPQVLAHDGQIYMMPETQQANRLEIWRAVRFPQEWTLHATALQGHFPADSSLYRQGSDWWLFTNLSDHHAIQEHSSELYLFKVDGPDLRKVDPHPLNPVVVGSNVARNAGSVVAAGGKIYRPSQNNSNGIYGYGLNIMRIDRLDTEGYQETRVRAITPADLPGASGVHHASFAEGRYVMDVLMRKRSVRG